MNKLLSIFLATLMLLAVSCKKDNPKENYGVDGVTPMPDAVDLGLESGLKWASFNLGASKEHEYGDYYTWGETSAKQDYTWATNIYANGEYNRLTKYCPRGETTYWDAMAKPEGPDGEIQLLPSDDVAHVKLGGKWRMPTRDDINELLALKTNDDYTWEKWVLATDADGNEVKDAWGNVVRGIRITRKSTGARLFLPAAGRRDGAQIGWVGSCGLYWSSSLYSDYPSRAYCLNFDSYDSNWYGGSRQLGFTVRPVSE